MEPFSQAATGIFLIWSVAFMTPQGVVSVQIQDETKFGMFAFCQKFGQDHEQRMKDFVRGKYDLLWTHDIAIHWTCKGVHRES